MAIYAHVAGGVIVEIFTPPPGMTIEQLFHSSLTWVDITGRNPQPQVGWNAVFNSGLWTITAPILSTPTPAQQAQAILGTSVQIVSSSQPSLTAIYPIDPESRVDVMAEMLSIAANQRFTNGQTTLGVLDIAGGVHTFDIPHYQSYATAIGQFVTVLKLVAAGTMNTLPKMPVQII